MPTLNGWLLGYPVVYLVSSYEEAAKASRLLSAAPLRRFWLRLRCGALEQLNKEGGAGASQQSSTSSVGSSNEDVLMAFTVPEELHTPSVAAAVAALVARVGAACGAHPSVWCSGPPALAVESVGPGAVSL